MRRAAERVRCAGCTHCAAAANRPTHADHPPGGAAFPCSRVRAHRRPAPLPHPTARADRGAEADYCAPVSYST